LLPQFGNQRSGIDFAIDGEKQRDALRAGQRGKINGMFSQQIGGLNLLLRRKIAAQMAHMLTNILTVEKRECWHDVPG